MLILCRRVHETIVIDGVVRIVVTEVNGQSVKLGITAPRGITILRSELEARPVPASAANLSAPEGQDAGTRKVAERA